MSWVEEERDGRVYIYAHTCADKRKDYYLQKNLNTIICQANSPGKKYIGNYFSESH